jgi:hypothetical protein
LDGGALVWLRCNDVIESVCNTWNSLKLCQTTARLLEFCDGFETMFQNMNYCKTIVEIRWSVSLIAKQLYQFYNLIQWPVPIETIWQLAQATCLLLMPATAMKCEEIVVFCHIQVSATGRSLVQKSPTECGVPEWDLETSTIRRPGLNRVIAPQKWRNMKLSCFKTKFCCIKVCFPSHTKLYP